MTETRTLSDFLAPFLAAALAFASGAEARDGLAGPYLAARLASQNADYAAAADYFTQAIAADPTNPAFLQDAILADIGRGAVDRAIQKARLLDTLDARSQIADMAVLTDLAKKGEFAAALQALKDGRSSGALVDKLYRAWAMVGEGQMSNATAEFDALSQAKGLQSIALYHKALALAAAGDFEGAEQIFSGDAGGPLRATRRGIVAHVQILSQLERNGVAIELIDKIVATGSDAEFAAMRARLAAGETLPFGVVTSPSDGIAEVFLTVASAMQGDAADLNTLTFSRMAEYLRPNDAEAILLSAGILESQEQYDLAIESYGRVARADPAFAMAELGRAEALVAAGRIEAAIEALRQLARAEPDRPDIWSALGDTFRREERYAEAAQAYDTAIASFKTAQEAQWPVYYTRGIAHEREKDWDAAEADFRKALELKPDQPQVLNYLGYSYLEMNTRIDEAMAMIERAVAARPDDGAIVDSLGWALYRMQRYGDAVVQMEQAVELMPVDPVINDHLGDVYWAVGRKREAEFQWRRALSFDPEEKEATRIRRKLEAGLDAVLAEEGAKPLTPVDAAQNGH